MKEYFREKGNGTLFSCCLAVILIVLLSYKGVLADGQDISFSMEENSGAYVLNGKFQVPVQRELVWSVLTDYNHLKDFVSSIASSQITETDKDYILVDQRGHANFLGFFDFNIHALLKITEEPLFRISFYDLLNENFEYYSGCWQIETKGQGTSVLYHLKAKPNFFAPAFIAGGVFDGNARELLKQVRAEIIKRDEKSRLDLSKGDPKKQ